MKKIKVILGALVAVAACSGEQKPVKTFFRPSVERLEKQTFVVKAEKSEIFRGRYGSIWGVPPRAFVDSAGRPVTGEVEIELIEAVRWRDLVVGGLETRTAVGDSLLSTGGMFRIRATQNGAELFLDKGLAAYIPQNLFAGQAQTMNRYYSDTAGATGVPLWRYAGGQGLGQLRKCRSKAADDPCRDCKKLLRQIAKIKIQKTPKNSDDWYGDRYAYDGDSLYFYSSGKRTGLFSKNDIQRCRKLTADDAEAQKLFTRLDLIRKQQTENTSFFSFYIHRLGWWNVDKVVDEEMKNFSGTIANAEGKPVVVELLDKTRNVKISTTSDEQGRFEFRYPPGSKPHFFAYSENRYAFVGVELTAGAPIAPISLSPVEEKDYDATLEKICRFLDDPQKSSMGGAGKAQPQGSRFWAMLKAFERRI
ncbi:MAG: carboxypeptidase-like regulatory domain-containing protein [Bacteroidia bacterium]|nr:carboxypeptidase-like regulatory domain-containing protein [Bacteroidia bacterium]